MIKKYFFNTVLLAICCVISIVLNPTTASAQDAAFYDESVPKPTLSISRYGGHAFGKANFEQFLEERESVLPWIAEYSPYALVSTDDPPVYLLYNSPPALGQNQKDPTHTANFGVKLKEHCEKVSIECELKYPDAPNVKHETPTDYLIASLKRTAGVSEMNKTQKQPNVLFIAIDDLRPELGCYGANHIKSPNIDKLASQGVLFNKAYCHAPHCMPSRASMLTGIHIQKSNILIDIEQFASGAPTLPGTFRIAGYYTICNGKIFHQNEDMAKQSWSEPPFSLVNGKKENNHLTFHDKESANYILEKNQRGPFFEAPDVPNNTYIDGQNCDKTIKDLGRLAEMDKPFFMACGFVRPHLPFYAPKKYWDLYDREKIAIAENRYKPRNAPDALTGSGEFGSYHGRDIEYNSEEFHKIARHGYYACVSYADDLVGRLLSTLDELGLRENTIVVVWGDHGWNLGEHSFWSKHNLLYTSKNAPLIISSPGFKQNIKTDGIVEFVDIYPTLCELAGIKLPEHLEGASVVPLMQNPDKSGKEAAFTYWRKGGSITTQDFSYTEYDNNERMLFDLKKDPNENENVAENPNYVETVEQLSQLLADGWKNGKQKK